MQKIKKRLKTTARFITRKRLIIFISLFAIINISILIYIKAAAPSLSIEPESSSISGNACIKADTQASIGKAVQFGNCSAVQVSELPVLLGNFYMSFSNYNGPPIFCSDSLHSEFDAANNRWRQYYVFGGTGRNPLITARTLPNGKWESPVDLTNVLLGSFDDDGHNCITVVADSEGYLHVSGNHHVKPLKMARSTRPHDITSWVNVPNMVGITDERQVTYPEFIKTKDGTLLFAYRNGYSGRTGKWYINKWNPNIGNPGQWERVVWLTDGQDESFYPHRISVDRTNTATKGRIHVFGTWRIYLEGSTGPTNEDLVHFYSDDNAVTWKQYGRTAPLTLPITKDKTNVVLNSDTHTSTDRFILNSGGMDIDNKGRPHALVNMSSAAGVNDRLLYHVWYDGSRWIINKLPSNHSRSSVIAEDNGNIWGMVNGVSGSVRDFSLIDLNPESTTYLTKRIKLFDGMINSLNNAKPDLGLWVGLKQLSFMSSQIGGEPPDANGGDFRDNWKQPGFITTIPSSQFGAISIGGINIPKLVTVQKINLSAAKTFNATLFQRFISSTDIDESSLVYVRLTVQAHMATNGPTLTIKAAKTGTTGKDITFGQLDFTSTSSVTKKTPWLPVNYKTAFKGTLGIGGYVSSGSSVIDSATLEVAVLQNVAQN